MSIIGGAVLGFVQGTLVVLVLDGRYKVAMDTILSGFKPRQSEDQRGDESACFHEVYRIQKTFHTWLLSVVVNYKPGVYVPAMSSPTEPTMLRGRRTGLLWIPKPINSTCLPSATHLIA
ncbi:hypothetical protein B0I37DRAFT_350478 [Chaetomium sp. MPI-CAGE-AT-0009]|nr:hypothetical protein B0I37DRAFT_350478 [Chaetomium sp. MPI-CAGE-AT-0009]